MPWDRLAGRLLAEITEEPLHNHPEHPEENCLARETVGWAEQVERSVLRRAPLPHEEVRFVTSPTGKPLHPPIPGEVAP